MDKKPAKILIGTNVLMNCLFVFISRLVVVRKLVDKTQAIIFNTHI